MYPYNRPTQHYAKKTSTQIKSNETAAVSSLANDRRLLSLLNISETDAKNMLERYKTMLNDEALSDQRNMIQSMCSNEIKHAKLLRDATYQIAGTYPTCHETALPVSPCRESGRELMENTLLMELDNAGYYRDIMLNMPTEELRDIFFEILSDKQNQCHCLNYLLRNR